MLKIDNTLLQEVGLGALPAAEKNSFLKHIYETLEMRVGIRLADQMSNQQLDEFERYFEAKDDAGAFKWLETNFPNYKEIVQQEFDKLKAEVAQSAPQILAASQQAAVQGGQTAQPAAAGAAPHTAPMPQSANPAPVVDQPPVSQPPYQAQPSPQSLHASPPNPNPVPPTQAFASGSGPNQQSHAAPTPQPQFQQPQPVPQPQQSPFPPQQPPAGPTQQ